MRYLLALFVAAILIGTVFLYGSTLYRAVIAEMKADVDREDPNDPHIQEFKRHLEAGRLPPEWGGMVSSSIMWKLQLMSLIYGLWPIWAGLIFAACLGGAWAISPKALSH